MNANKPPPDTKGGKLAPGTVNNNKDLDVDVKKEEPSFFGSFFSSAKNAPKKKGAAVMDSVSRHPLVCNSVIIIELLCSPHHRFARRRL